MTDTDATVPASVPASEAASRPDPRPAFRPWTDQSTHRDWLKGQARGLIDFYRPACVNPKGGFFDLDDHGRPLPTGWPPGPTPSQALFASVRMIHCFSIAHLLGLPGAGEIVDHGMDFLWKRHRDTTHGGYCWGVGQDGPTDSSKQAYGHAFVLLAGASAKSVGHPDADRLIEDATSVLLDRFWEPAHGALAEEFDADWSPLGTYRGQNSNMHFVESAMAAHEATGESRYLEMAGQVADLLIRRITAGNDWMLPEHFDDRWNIDREYDRDVFRPYGTTVGHWLEWSRLLVELWDLGGRETAWMLDAAQTLFRKAVSMGWSPERGGFWFTLDWEGRPRDPDRYWWPCAEGSSAASVLFRVTGDAFYEEWYRRIWSWTDKHLIEHVNGSWHFQLDDALVPTTDPWYGKPDLYHSLQACLIPLLPVRGSVTEALLRDGI